MDVEISRSTQNLLPTAILGLSLPGMRLHFSLLQSLALSNVQQSCTDAGMQDMISALNISSLRKLRLRIIIEHIVKGILLHVIPKFLSERILSIMVDKLFQRRTVAFNYSLDI